MYEGHSVAFCPILHGICETCGRRGHAAEIHERIQEDSLSLHQIEYCTLHWSPLGKFTCVPFLELTPRAEEVSDKHWRYLAPNQKRVSCQRLFWILSIAYKAPKCRARRQRRTGPPSDEAPRKSSKQAEKRRASSLPRSGFKIPKTAKANVETSQSDVSSVGTHAEPTAGTSGYSKSKSRSSRQARSKGKGKAPVSKTSQDTSSQPPKETERERIMRIELETLRHENELLRMHTPGADLSDDQFVRIRRRAQFIRRFYEEARVNLEEGDIDVLVNIDMRKNPQFYDPDSTSIPMSEETFPTSELKSVMDQEQRDKGIPAGMEESDGEYIPTGEHASDVVYIPSRTEGEEHSAEQDASSTDLRDQSSSDDSSDGERSSSDEHTGSPGGPKGSPLTPRKKAPSRTQQATSTKVGGKTAPSSSAVSDQLAEQAAAKLDLNTGEQSSKEGPTYTTDEPTEMDTTSKDDQPETSMDTSQPPPQKEVPKTPSPSKSKGK